MFQEHKKLVRHFSKKLRSYTNNLHLPITEPAYNKHFAPNDPQIQNCAHRDFLAHDY